MSKSLTYADAGVDIDAGNALVDRLKTTVKSTNRPGVMSGLGGFGGLFDLRAAGYDDPILVSATDGVGTKLKIAIDTGLVDTVGVDLVAMCVNDLICQGAEPLFFLDYFATGVLSVDIAERVIAGIAAGCAASNCALIGGETAEMPGMYAGGDFDLAGFAVGAMNRGAALPQGIGDGDVLIGLAASGVHSNGFSLVRKVADHAGVAWDDPAPFAPDTTLGAALLTPTQLYVTAAVAGIKQGFIKGLAHITGGGLTENLPRVLPGGLGAQIDLAGLTLPPVMGWLQSAGNIAQDEMLKTFNCGVGMVAVVSPDDQARAVDLFATHGHAPVVLGHVCAGQGVGYVGELV